MSQSSSIKKSVLPLNSWVLVTGCNGLIGTHVADQFLAAGFRVRGTVRDIEKNSWMLDFFNSKYGPDRFSLVTVEDLAAPGAFDDAVKGVSAVAHTASSVDFNNVNIEIFIKSGVNCLESAAAEPSVQAVVYTGSSWAIATPDPTIKRTVDTWTYNEAAVNAAKDRNQAKTNPTAAYTASKVEAERAMWEWVKQHNPSFRFNVMLIGTTFGHVLSPENQGIPSTAGYVKEVVTGSEKSGFLVKIVQPQWYTDAGDVGRLHVSAVAADVNKERLFGLAEPFNWDQVLDISRKYFPKETSSTKYNPGQDQTSVPNGRAGQLLKDIYDRDFTPLEQSIKRNVEAFLPQIAD